MIRLDINKRNLLQVILNIDTLSLAYVVSTEILNIFETQDFIEYIDFSLHKVSENTFAFDKTFSIIIPDFDIKTQQHFNRKLGYLHIGSRFEKEGDSQKRYVWLNIDNEVLYNESFHYINEVVSRLSLKFNNLTKLEIALDSNINFSDKIKRAIRKDEYIPIINNKARVDREKTIEEILYVHKGNRKRYTTLSIYVKQKEGLQLKTYDKLEEIINSEKSYILSDYKTVPKKLFRAEITVGNYQIKEYLNKRQLSIIELWNILKDEEQLLDMWLYYSERLIRFRNNNGEILSVLEI